MDRTDPLGSEANAIWISEILFPAKARREGLMGGTKMLAPSLLLRGLRFFLC
jgi:hypothetical protein